MDLLLLIGEMSGAMIRALTTPIEGIGLTVKECVDKQKTKGVVLTGTEDKKYYRCPDCGQILVTEYCSPPKQRMGRVTKYCESCGQCLENVVKIVITKNNPKFLGNMFLKRVMLDKDRQVIYLSEDRKQWITAEAASNLGIEWEEVYETAKETNESK